MSWERQDGCGSLCRFVFDIIVSTYHSIKMRTTINLAEDVYEAAKTLAEGSGKSLGAVVSELARRGLQPHLGQRGQDLLPVFSVPAEAELIPGNRAIELLAEEGAD